VLGPCLFKVVVAEVSAGVSVVSRRVYQDGAPCLWFGDFSLRWLLKCCGRVLVGEVCLFGSVASWWFVCISLRL